MYSAGFEIPNAYKAEECQHLSRRIELSYAFADSAGKVEEAIEECQDLLLPDQEILVFTYLTLRRINNS